MDDKMEEIFQKYEGIVLESLERHENGEGIDPAPLGALNDCIRILHHIAQLRGYAPQGTSR